MRLIDADRLRKIFEDGEYPCKLQDMLLGIVDVQPTALDADKVVEQLKALKMRYFLTIANTGDADKDCAYKNIANTIDKAVEIVKGGGLNE
uniref:Uncharacterized protein n=1 Tax=Siphoviridae sp. ctGMq5 TaxID=2826220 RepID=A0A8S5NNK8_9CAUD|nr:MAG TPA: hypothetical protein [Siphoviridae sp. ctGMq5]